MFTTGLRCGSTVTVWALQIPNLNLSQTVRISILVHIFLLFPLSQILPIASFIHSSLFVSIAIFGPPILTTYTTVSSLHVNVNLPLGPNGVSVANIITNSKNRPFKTEIDYTLKITHPVWAAQVSLPLNNRTCCTKVFSHGIIQATTHEMIKCNNQNQRWAYDRWSLYLLT